MGGKVKRRKRTRRQNLKDGQILVIWEKEQKKEGQERPGVCVLRQSEPRPPRVGPGEAWALKERALPLYPVQDLTSLPTLSFMSV